MGTTVRIWPYVALSFAVAVFIDLSHFHRMGHADSIVPVLSSLYAWTPYYWESNRFGMLVPLLAIPFHNPLTNLLVQYALNLAFLIGSQFLIGRYAIPHRGWPLCAALALTVFFACASPQMTFDAAFQPWIIGAALGVGGLILLEPLSEGRRPVLRIVVAGALFGLAQWVNLAAIATVLPLAGMRFLLGPATRRLRLQELFAGAALSLLALLASIQIAIRAEHQNTFIGLTEPALWPASAVLLARNLFLYGVGSGDNVPRGDASWPWVALALGLLGACFLAAQTRRADVRLGARGFLAIAACALTFWLFLSTQTHMQWTGYASRYMVPVGLMGVLAFCSLLGAPLARGLSERGLPIICGVLLLGGATAGFGPPHLDGVRADVTARWGRSTDDVIALGATHLSGSYWSVWPAMWHANWVLYRAGETRKVWGITPRAVATKPLWSGWPLADVRVAIPSNDLAEGQKWVKQYGLPALRQAEQHGTMTLFVAQDR